MQRFAHLFTEKVMEAINIGLMEMAQISQNTFTPDFVLIGMLQQEDSLLLSVFERMASSRIKVMAVSLQEVREGRSICLVHLARPHCRGALGLNQGPCVGTHKGCATAPNGPY